MGDYMRVEDLDVYQKLCRLHIEVCQLSRHWPADERFELTSQVRRASNSAPANLAEKHSDRHLRNKIEGVNRARGEVLETIHHLYIASLKDYLAKDVIYRNGLRHADICLNRRVLTLPGYFRPTIHSLQCCP